MKDKKIITTNYLTLTYKILITNKIIHSFLFLLEMLSMSLQIVEIYYNNYNENIQNNSYFSPYTFLLIHSNILPNSIKAIIFIALIAIIIITYFIFNFIQFDLNLISKIMINLSELLFYRALSLFLFNLLLNINDYYFVISLIFAIPYIIIIIFNIYKNHLSIFFPSLIRYPFDTFSMLIDFHLLLIKILISVSSVSKDQSESKFFFLLSIVIYFILLIYSTYLLFYKSYYLMNNCFLNKQRYSIILSFGIIIILILLIDKEHFNNIYFVISYWNILLICLFFVNYIYNPYTFSKFDKDDNIENSFYYLFILDRNKNKNLLIEEKIEEHLSMCKRCDLCEKYNMIKNRKENEEIDLYKIISNNKDIVYNLINKIVRIFKKGGKKSFMNDSHLLINIIYIYCMAMNQKRYNIVLNCELLFDIINYENRLFLEDNKIALNNIKYTNDFFIKAHDALELICQIFDEKKILKKAKLFFVLGEKLDGLKFKDTKSYLNSNFGDSNNGNNIEGLPNCNNLLTICSLFYEELYNESFSNSGISIRDTPNLLEDLINNNFKNSKQITLEIDMINFEVKIIRAGGTLNKYENNNFFDFFSPIFKKKQIKEMKKVILCLNDNCKVKSKKTKKEKSNKGKGEKQYMKFNFIIEEKEKEEIFCKLLKMKLTFIFLTQINNKIYLNGVYIIDDNIIVTEQMKENEILLNFGNNEQKSIAASKNNNNRIIIKSSKNGKYLGNKKLVKIYDYFGCKKYNVYHFIMMNRTPVYERNKNKGKKQSNCFEEENNKKDNNNLIFNDLASQNSSTNSSFSSGNLLYYNRGNKKNKNVENVMKELKIIKLFLYLFILIYLVYLVCQSISLNIEEKKIKVYNDFYIFYGDYCTNFYSLVISVLSLGCIANSTQSYTCKHYMDDLTMTIINNYFKILIENDNISEDILKSNFTNFVQLVFSQSQIFSDNFNGKLNELSNYFSIFENDIILDYFNNPTPHYKLNHNSVNGKLNLNLRKENITFSDFNKLMASRFSILTREINQTKQPIYILNKTGEYSFINIYLEDKLTSYQENYYLLILDYKLYSKQLNIIIKEITNKVIYKKSKFKKLTYFFINFNLFFFAFMLIIINFYMITYFIIILKTLKKILNELNEKYDDITIKELMRNKIDNLKLMLNFYENDISKTMKNLDKIYKTYRENQNLKLKEGTKLLRREEKNENKYKLENIANYIKAIKNIKKFALLENSGRKNLYLFSLLFIIILYFIIYIYILFSWISFFNKDKIVREWNIISQDANFITNRMMDHYLLMIYSNQTLREISIENETEDFVNLIYSKLTPLYKLEKYTYYLTDLLKTTENTMFYDCSDFYENLENDNLRQLKNKFIEEEDKLIYTMWFFCDLSNAMIFHNFKTIYLQLFNQVTTDMQNFSNNNYSQIIEFIEEKEIVKNEIMYLIIYIYVMDIMSQNVKSSILGIFEQTKFNIIATNTVLLVILAISIFIIYIVFIQNINNDSIKFIHIRKIFKICNLNE